MGRRRTVLLEFPVASMDSVRLLDLPGWLLLRPICAWHTLAGRMRGEKWELVMAWENGALAEFVRVPLVQVGKPPAGACSPSPDLGVLGLKGMMKWEWEELRQRPRLWRERPGWEELQ